jgi:hypothetical protein
MPIKVEYIPIKRKFIIYPFGTKVQPKSVDIGAFKG